MLDASNLRDSFFENGFLGPIRLLTKEECAEAIERTLQLPRSNVWEKGAALSSFYLYQLATKPEILTLIKNLLGEDALLWGSRIVQKKPGSSHPWHTYIECAGDTGLSVSLWIGLENTNIDSSLQVITFSHGFDTSVQEVAYRAGIHRAEISTDDVLNWAQEFNPLSCLKKFDMQNGDALLMHGKLWHHSRNTSSEGERTALLFQYCTPDAVIRMPIKHEYEWPFHFSDVQPPCIVVSGTDRFKVNRTIAPPEPERKRNCWTRSIDSLTFREKKEGWKAGRIFKGSTSSLQKWNSHVSILEEGIIPHDPHSHEEEELLIVLSGQVDIIRAGTEGVNPASERLQRGQFVYHPAYSFHTIRSAGPGAAMYLMFKWKGEQRNTNDQMLKASTFHIDSGRIKQKKGLKQTRIFQGPTDYLKKLHAHLTVLQPQAGYEPHRDSYDVAILVLDGIVETLNQQTGPNSLVFYPANEPHGMKNVGEREATYLVFEFHGDR